MPEAEGTPFRSIATGTLTRNTPTTKNTRETQRSRRRVHSQSAPSVSPAATRTSLSTTAEVRALDETPVPTIEGRSPLTSITQRSWPHWETAGIEMELDQGWAST